MAFKRRIYEVREDEVEAIRKLGLGRSVERAVAKSIGFLSSFAIFLIALHMSMRIDSSFIFSILVIAGIVKSMNIYAVYGIDLLYELNAIFERFAFIFNVELNSKDRRLPEATLLGKLRTSGHPVVFESYSTFFQDNDQPLLSDISCHF